MLSIEVEFLRGVFDAGGENDDLPPEWPPHPARLFNALVASADHEDAGELDALRWLEAAPPPAIVAAERSVVCGGRSSYVPTNRIEKSGSYGRFSARKGLGPRTWCGVSPADPHVTYRWPTEPPEGVAATLSSLAARVPYLGRSLSPIVATAYLGETAPPRRLCVEFRPGESGTAGRVVELPRPGYLDDLEAAFAEGRKAHEVARSVAAYSVPGVATEPLAQSPYGEMIVLGFEGSRRFGQSQIVTITSRLREAIQSHVDGGPPVLRGQRPGEPVEARHQVAIVGLPHVANPHISGPGRVLGLALLLPRDITSDDRRTVVRGLTGVLRTGLWLGRLGEVRLDPGVQQIDTLRAARWSRPERAWVSATPISANRYHRGFDHGLLVADLVDSCRHLDLPEASVTVRRTGFIQGAEQLPARARVRHPNDAATSSFHAVVEFAEPVAGPIVLGSMRRYGLGLMLPCRDGDLHE